MLDSLKVPEKLPDCIEEPVKAALTPPAATAGSAISDLLELVFWPISTASKLASSKRDFLLAKQQEKQRLLLAQFHKEIEDRIKTIPEEKRIIPDSRIATDAMEKAKSALEVDDIRRMYANLIANSANSDVASQIHPSFSTIISQLSSLDAQNLEIIDMLGVCPIARFEIHNKKGQGFRIMHPDVFLSNPDQQDTSVQAVSLNTLARLQLIYLDYSLSLAGEQIYSDIEAYFTQYIGETNISEPIWGITKGATELTFLGHAFLAVCRSPYDSPSETSEK